MFKLLSGISLLVLSITIPEAAVAQESSDEKTKIGNHQKGSFYAFWGWNRGYYSKSDVTFKGDNYEFEIKDMTASDRPTAIGIDPYLNPLDMTLPQTNFKVGYFIEDNYAISFGVDHMKYIMDQEQTANINGYINVGSIHDGTYNNQDVYMGQRAQPTADQEIGDVTFLAFEHSDGLNYINVELNRFDELYAFSPKFKFSRILGAGVGFMLPRTNATLLTNERHDDFHLSGWGAHIKAGLEISYKKYFFRSEIKTGYTDMPDIRTTRHSSDTASQHFTFTQWNFLFGRYFSF